MTASGNFRRNEVIIELFRFPHLATYNTITMQETTPHLEVRVSGISMAWLYLVRSIEARVRRLGDVNPPVKQMTSARVDHVKVT